MAKDELQLKQNMVNQRADATRETNKVFDNISKSIESVGKTIGDGLLALAGAIGNTNNNGPAPFAPVQQYPQDYNYYHQPYGGATLNRSASASGSSMTSTPFTSPQSESSSTPSLKRYETLH